MLAVWAGASQAFAHNSLTSTNPADQETVQGPPRAVVLTFDDPVIARGAQVLVTGPSGQIQQGKPGLAKNTVTQDLQPGAAAGTYTVSWRVTWQPTGTLYPAPSPSPPSNCPLARKPPRLRRPLRPSRHGCRAG